MELPEKSILEPPLHHSTLRAVQKIDSLVRAIEIVVEKVMMIAGWSPAMCLVTFCVDRKETQYLKA